MDTITVITSIGSGIGIASIVGNFVQHKLTQSAKNEERRLNELKESFTGFLSAFANLNKDDKSRENQMNFALWRARVQLVASEDVNASISELMESAPNSPLRTTSVEKMINSMRSDMKIAVSPSLRI